MGLFDRFRKKEEKKPKSQGKEIVGKGGLVKEKPLTPKIKKDEKAKKKEERPALKEKPKKVKKDDTGEAYRILLKPLLTEKATNLGVTNQYVFKVALKANKQEIKKAIWDLYGVRVVKVNIINQRGKEVKYGRSVGRTNNWKKAILTLKPNEKIEIYEGV